MVDLVHDSRWRLRKFVSAAKRCGNPEASSSAGANSPARSTSGAGAIASSSRLGNGAPQHLLCLSPTHPEATMDPCVSISLLTRAHHVHADTCPSLRINASSLTSAPGHVVSHLLHLALSSHTHATRSIVIPTFQRVGLKANCWRARAS
jgi:hypothetical protein